MKALAAKIEQIKTSNSSKEPEKAKSFLQNYVDNAIQQHQDYVSAYNKRQGITISPEDTGVVDRGHPKDRDFLLEIVKLRQENRSLKKENQDLEDYVQQLEGENRKFSTAQYVYEERLVEETKLRKNAEIDINKHKNQFLDVKALLSETLEEAKVQAVELQKSREALTKLEGVIDSLEEEVESERDSARASRKEVIAAQETISESQRQVLDLERNVRDLEKALEATELELLEYKQKTKEPELEPDLDESELADEAGDTLQHMKGPTHSNKPLDFLDEPKPSLHSEEVVDETSAHVASQTVESENGNSALNIVIDENQNRPEEESLEEDELVEEDDKATSALNSGTLQKREILEEDLNSLPRFVRFDTDQHNHEAGQKCSVCEEERLKREKENDNDAIEEAQPIPVASMLHTSNDPNNDTGVTETNSPPGSPKPSFKYLLLDTDYYELLRVPRSISDDDDWDEVMHEAEERIRKDSSYPGVDDKLNEALLVLRNPEYKKEYDGHLRNVRMFREGFNATQFKEPKGKGMFSRSSVKSRSRFFIADEQFVCLFWSKNPIQKESILKLFESTQDGESPASALENDNEFRMAFEKNVKSKGIKYLLWKDVQSITRTGKLRGITEERGGRTISVRSKDTALHVEMGSRSQCTSVILTLCRINNFVMF